MSKTPNGDYQRRARIGIGASIGTIFGAGVAELLFDGAHFVIIGLTIGAALGAVVGTQLKSESFQFIWIEYSKDISRRLWLAGGLFLAPFSLYLLAKKWVSACY